MRQLMTAAVIAFSLAGVMDVKGAEPDKSSPTIPDQVGEAWDRVQQLLQDWSDRLRERFSGRESEENRPVISEMLTRKDELELSPEQVKKLEQLRDGFERQSIRNRADSRIVELDISELLDQPAVDLTKVEAKIREAEKLRADLRIARIRTIEQAKTVLTPEQRKKFYDSAASLAPRTPRGQNPPARE